MIRLDALISSVRDVHKIENDRALQILRDLMDISGALSKSEKETQAFVKLNVFQRSIVENQMRTMHAELINCRRQNVSPRSNISSDFMALEEFLPKEDWFRETSVFRTLKLFAAEKVSPITFEVHEENSIVTCGDNDDCTYVSYHTPLSQLVQMFRAKLATQGIVQTDVLEIRVETPAMVLFTVADPLEQYTRFVSNIRKIRELVGQLKAEKRAVKRAVEAVFENIISAARNGANRELQGDERHGEVRFSLKLNTAAGEVLDELIRRIHARQRTLENLEQEFDCYRTILEIQSFSVPKYTFRRVYENQLSQHHVS